MTILSQNFIDKYRWQILIILTGLLFGLCNYGGRYHPWLSLNDCLKNPEKYDGLTVSYIHEPRIQEILPDGFILHHGAGTIRVYSDTTGLRINEYIGLVAVYHKEGYLVKKDMIVAEKRRYKIFLSIIPVFFVLILFL